MATAVMRVEVGPQLAGFGAERVEFGRKKGQPGEYSPMRVEVGPSWVDFWAKWVDFGREGSGNLGRTLCMLCPILCHFWPISATLGCDHPIVSTFGMVWPKSDQFWADSVGPRSTKFGRSWRRSTISVQFRPGLARVRSILSQFWTTLPGFRPILVEFCQRLARLGRVSPMPQQTEAQNLPWAVFWYISA